MNRIPALDGLRGVLAGVVVIHHCLRAAGSNAALLAANISVLCFFIMSGYVLGRSYDGQPVAFLARRVVRLWPLYAVCMIAGFGLLHQAPPLADMLMWPPTSENAQTVDLPVWSLYLELWGSPALLVLFWLARKGRGVALAATLTAATIMMFDPRFFVVTFFAIGVSATCFDIRFPANIPGWALWLGKISFSLYLTHWIVINTCAKAFGGIGICIAALAVLPVAWVAWRTIERPSITLSRHIGRQPLSQPREAIS